MNDIFGSYKSLRVMYTKTIEAFEYYENNQEDTKLREVLQFWREYLVSSSCDCVPVSREHLQTFENELFESYSPIELTKERIKTIRDDVVKYFFQHTVDEHIQNDSTLLVSRLLYNCLMVENCFFPLNEIGYINHICNIRNQINLCIIISQMDYFSEYFRHLLFRFNDEFDSVKEVSAHILHVVGVLNFKCHNYLKAIEIFKQAIERFEMEQRNDVYKDNEYFQTKLLLAYCFEYDHQFEPAIVELVGMDVGTLIKIFKANNFNMFDLFDKDDIIRAKAWSERFIGNTMTQHIPEANPKGLFWIADKRDSLFHNTIGDKHEVLHSIAHCLNELGIKWKLTDVAKENVIHLLNLSRALMLYVAEYDNECIDFQTCLYMIFGEAKDYDICLKRINQLINDYTSSTKNINFDMENMFYLFLVSSQSNRTITDEAIEKRAEDAYNKFIKFAQHRYDYDALIHIEIFKFRFEMVKILRSSVDNNGVESRLIELRSSSMGKNIFTIKPSAKVNKWVIQEYNKTIALYEFLIKYFDSNNVNINELFNYASRFSFYRNLFTNDNDKHDIRAKEDIIDSVIESVVDDFISPQSIFLLAPITSAIPYQHQTESFNVLEENIFQTELGHINSDGKLEHFSELVYINIFDRINIDWFINHKEYGLAFAAFKLDSDIEFDRYHYCTTDADIIERPIHNVEYVNQLISEMHRANKRHSYCRNGQLHCCTNIINEKSDETNVKKICRELMIPFEKYQNKYFVFFFKKGKNGKNNNNSWYIIAVNNKLGLLQEEEIISQLCGFNMPRKHKLAVSTTDYCFISFGAIDTAVVKSDLLQLQEHGVRFWYNKELTESKEWSEQYLTYMKNAKCIVVFISRNTFESVPDNMEIYQEILYAIDNQLDKRLIIPIGFNNVQSFENFLDNKVRMKDRGTDVLEYLKTSPIILRSQGDVDFADHLTENSGLLKQLQLLEVVRNDI